MIAADFIALAWHAAREHLDLFGSLGLCLGFASGMMPSRSAILLTAAACSASFALHYLQLGATTGTAMCLISVMQSLVAARWIGTDARAAWVVPLFVGSSLVAACLTLATWNGWPSACAGLGALFATAARLQGDAQCMRRFFLGASSCWMIHNTLVGSVFGLTCDVLTISALLVALLRGGPARVSEPALVAAEAEHLPDDAERVGPLRDAI
ncbi:MULTISPECIES: YgjV family protein [unclassified Methylobacterium]|uniref:YgjV family protein n=1 Tax=unclassified Methylobacterium TaxID=2615210 RepID=UPI00370137A8